MKILFTALLLSGVLRMAAQVNLNEPLNVREYKFFYQDTVANKVFSGNYAPTGCIVFNSGALIISTELDPQYSHDSAYIANRDIYNGRDRVCGGVFKVDDNFRKTWEVFFQEKRVVRISKTSGSTFLIAGERIDQEKFWMAAMDTNGHIIWQKEYRFHLEPDVANLQADDDGNAYLLITAERIMPVAITKYDWYCRKKYRLKFSYHTYNDGDLYLVKIDQSGEWRWSRKLDRRRRRQTFGKDLLLSPGHIYASSIYLGAVVKNRKWVEDKGNIVYVLNRRGRLLNKSGTNHYNILNADNGLFTAQSGHDTVRLYNNDVLIQNPLVLKGAEEVWVQKWLKGSAGNYILASWDHNLGTSIIQLNRDKSLKGFWKDDIKAQSTNATDIAEKPDGSLIILSKNARRSTMDQRYNDYVNITCLKQL